MEKNRVQQTESESVCSASPAEESTIHTMSLARQLREKFPDKFIEDSIDYRGGKRSDSISSGSMYLFHVSESDISANEASKKEVSVQPDDQPISTAAEAKRKAGKSETKKSSKEQRRESPSDKKEA